MSATATEVDTSSLIAPHGGVLVDRVLTGADRERAIEEAGTLKRIDLSAKQSCDLEMIGIGAFSPLEGFMGEADAKRVCEEMKLTSGHHWPIPILLAVDEGAASVNDRVAMYAPNGVLQGILTVQEVFAHDKRAQLEQVFKADDEHPGVQQVRAEGDVCLAGPVEVLEVCVDPEGPEAFLDHRLTPAQTRAMFAEKGWKR
ncbi:MAG: sulfate adenylyltransferase, partial [Planctomycetota bacterium]